MEYTEFWKHLFFLGRNPEKIFWELDRNYSSL